MVEESHSDRFPARKIRFRAGSVSHCPHRLTLPAAPHVQQSVLLDRLRWTSLCLQQIDMIDDANDS